MFTINPRDTKPIFEQIVDQVASLIVSGVLKAHDQLPAVRTLAKELGINPNTVAKAYNECESQGLIFSLPGKGSFVSETSAGVQRMQSQAFETFRVATEQLIDLGVDYSTIIDFLKGAFE